MRTGWRPNPKSLADRINDDNNILIETWTSNAAKLDYSEADYGTIKELIKSCTVPKRLYNPGADLPLLPDPGLMAEAESSPEEVDQGFEVPDAALAGHDEEEGPGPKDTATVAKGGAAKSDGTRDMFIDLAMLEALDSPLFERGKALFADVLEAVNEVMEQLEVGDEEVDEDELAKFITATEEGGMWKWDQLGTAIIKIVGRD